MDVFRRQKFNEAMFAKNRTLAIRVGNYQSRDINEASFDYGYIKGDTYKPGGTCAGSAKIVFASVITSFNKLDKIYPEIGLLVDGTYEWVKMGEYFINDIEIDRNRKTTKLDLMDGMFKLNREHVTDLTYPAEIRNVIKEICLKTGIELANENMGLASMNYRIEQIPKDKKMTFRDVLSLATQMLGMSCFFNREGKLEVKELTDSGIVITADSYFMHGLTKSEIEYQIAGITCKKDKETLTVGLRTGRSLELDNLFMSQSILDNLYHSIKDIRYYPFSLNYQGHLLLDVGQWVTIKTNTGETFKSPVLSQSFNFKGGLRGRISADSKAGNDAQYSYAGTITKKIEQFNEFEAQLQNQIEEADRGFDAKVDQIKKDFNDQIELAKAKAEENKKALSDEIDRRFHDFSPAGFEEAKAKAEEALKKAGATADLVEEAKRIADENSVIFAGLADKVNKQDDKLADYKQDIDGRFTTLTSQIVGKVTQGGPNMLRNSRADDGLKYWNGDPSKFQFREHEFYLNGQKRMFLLGSGAVVGSPRFIFKKNTDYMLNLTAFDANTARVKISLRKRRKNSSADFDESQVIFEKTSSPAFSSNEAVKRSFSFNTGDFDNGYLVFEYTGNPQGWSGMFMTELDFYEGSNDRKWQPSPEDSEEPIETITQKLAEYKETVDGRFATISSQINSKTNQSDFQQVKETSQLYERILGSNDSNVASNIARMALTSELFEVEVGKRFSNLTNLFYAPTKIPKYISSVATDTHLSRVGWGDHDGIRINYTDSMSGWLGVRFPLTKKFVKQGESLGYRIEIVVDKVPRDGKVLIQLLDNTSNLNMYCNYPIPITKTGGQVFTGYLDIPSAGELNEYSLRFTLTSPGNIVIHKPMIVDRHIIPNEFIDSTDYNNEYNRVTMSLMKDSFAIKSLNSAGDIIAGINVGANGNNRIVGKATHITGDTLIDNAVIKSAMIDKLKTANFEAGSVTTTILGAGAVTADKVLMDTAMANKFVASDVFTNTLAAKTAFINKLRSVVVSATLLEGYKGKIGGFQIGTHDKDPNVYWLTGQNQFDVGMSNGSSRWDQAALWVNWGDNWDKSGPYAWYILRTGEMYCKNNAGFFKKVDFANESSVNFYGNINYYKEPKFFNGLNMWDSEIIGGGSNPKGGNNAVVWWNQIGSGSVKYWIDKSSDRRLKENITQTAVNALDRIDNLDMVEFDFIKDKKHEEIGLIAQEVERIIPQAISRNPDNPDDYLHIDYTALVPYLIKAIQELNKKVERLETT